MIINMNKLFKPFVACLNDMTEKYGEDFSRLNGLHNENLNFTDFIDYFTADNVKAVDATIDGNANNNSNDITNLMSEMVKPHEKLLAFNKIFYEITKQYGLSVARRWMELEWSGGLYLHDFSSASQVPYCFAYDIDELVDKGMFFIDKFKSAPAQHLTTFNNHVHEFISWVSNRTSGACGLPSYLIYSFYFWHKDSTTGYVMKDPEWYRRQSFQEFIYNLNQPYLRITQCAFTNITIMDRPYLMEIFGGRKFPDGTYVTDYIEEIIEHQKVFMEVVSEIRAASMFTFPVLTYSLLYQDGAFVDEEFARWCSDHNTEWCDSNFYIGSDVTSLSSCCRLVNDFSKLGGFINSTGGTSLKIGSIKVSTINLRRILLEVKTNLAHTRYSEDRINNDASLRNEIETEYFKLLREYVDIDLKVLNVIRHIIKRNIEKGLLHNYAEGLIDMNRQFNTVGINAMYETVRDLGYIEVDSDNNESYSDQGMLFASKVLDLISEWKDSYMFDYSVNVEAIPGERAANINARKDEALYPEYSQGDFLYSNQWVPLMSKCSLDEKIRLGALLDKKCGGGQISHINIEGEFATKDQAWELLNYIASKGVIYLAFCKKISVCEQNHGFHGNICPECGKPVVDYYSRIVGYLVPISSYSAARKQEFNLRTWYSLNE